MALCKCTPLTSEHRSNFPNTSFSLFNLCSYDLLRNETLYTGGEIIIQIVRDIAQGLRFLHASKPPILHHDLKAKNILIDSRFRAKVADFGLATKNKPGVQGTPYW